MPVLPGDDANALKARLGPLEHQLLKATVALFCNREITYRQGAVLYRGLEIRQPLQLQPDGGFI